jgi:hypothetical protein
MPELGTSGSVRGDASNGIPYRDKAGKRAAILLSVTSLLRLCLSRHGISHKARSAAGRCGQAQEIVYGGLGAMIDDLLTNTCISSSITILLSSRNINMRVPSL